MGSVLLITQDLNGNCEPPKLNIVTVVGTLAGKRMEICGIDPYLFVVILDQMHAPAGLALI